MLQVTNNKENRLEQELGEEVPSVENLGITGMKLKGAQLILTVEGVTNVTDVALLKRAWLDAVAEWLLSLCDGSAWKAKVRIQKIADRNRERQREVEGEEGEEEGS